MRIKRLSVAKVFTCWKTPSRLLTGLTLSSLVCLGPIAAEPLPLKIATRPNLPPYIQQEAASGIEIDVIKAIFEKAELPIKFVQMDRVEMISRFETGEMEGSLTQNVTASRHGCVTDWYLVHQNVGFSILDRKVQLNSLDELKNLRVVSFHNAKAFLGEAFSKAVENNPDYREIAPQSQHIDLLYQNSFDVIVGDEWIIRYVQRKHFEKTGEYKVLRVHPIMEPTLYSARFQEQATCDAFNLALNSIRKEGTYDRIVDGYHQRLLIAAKNNR